MAQIAQSLQKKSDCKHRKIKTGKHLVPSYWRRRQTSVILSFSSFQKKSPGCPFGTDMGVGLTLREKSSGSAAQHQRVQSCPDVLEMRELYQHRPFTTPLKHTIDSHLKVTLPHYHLGRNISVGKIQRSC